MEKRMKTKETWQTMARRGMMLAIVALSVSGLAGYARGQEQFTIKGMVTVDGKAPTKRIRLMIMAGEKRITTVLCDEAGLFGAQKEVRAGTALCIMA